MIEAVPRDFMIFYVDDDPEDLDVFAETGMSMGIEVIPISDADEMLERLHEVTENLKVIFLDINMPAKNGHDLLKEIRRSEDLKHFPIVVFSTGHDAVTIKKSWDYGADLFIRKGNSLDQYKEILQQVKSIDWHHFERDPKAFVLKLPAA